MERIIDEIVETPWKRTFISILRKKGLDKLVSQGETQFSNSEDKFLKDNWFRITEYTLLDPFRMGRILDLLNNTLSIEGDVVECGCYRGGTGLMIGLFFKANNIKKKIHLFDSFEGLPNPSNEKDKGYTEGDFKSEFDELSSLIKELGLEDYVVLHKGWFKDTIERFLEDAEKISLLHIDCDLYESTIDSFGPLQPLVSDGGVVVFDDYNDGGRGEKLAVEELLTDRTTMFMGPAPQVYYYNNHLIESDFMVSISQDINYSFDEILKNTDYLNWLKKVGKFDYAEKIQEICK